MPAISQRHPYLYPQLGHYGDTLPANYSREDPAYQVSYPGIHKTGATGVTGGVKAGGKLPPVTGSSRPIDKWRRTLRKV
jgi:hypothetical protein